MRFKPPSSNYTNGHVLLSYTTYPLTLLDETQTGGHTQGWEIQKMIELFLESGFTVDLIDQDNMSFSPKVKYSILVAAGDNADRLQACTPDTVLKVFHATGCHWLFQNQSEYKRLYNLQTRNGYSLPPQRQAYSIKNLQGFDIISGILGTYPTSTYTHLKKPLMMVPLSTTHTFEHPEKKDFDQIKKTFLWFGGAGGVHKGLDLVLEAFSQMPEYHLIVCGKPVREPDFAKAYHTELFETPNIEAVGHVDPGSEQFANIKERCLGIVYPSCSEGTAGSVVLAMHAGLIPIVTKESGVETKDFGITLKEATIEHIKDTVRSLSSEPTEKLKERATKTWEYARENHTRERFASEYRKFVATIVKLHHEKSH